MAAATVAALLVAKVVFIADKLPIINRFPEKPLMYNVVWKTAIYVAVSLLLHYLEHLLPMWWRMGSFGAPTSIWPEHRVAALLGDPALAVVLIFVYCALRELIRVVGRERVRQIFFVTPALRRADI